MKKILQIFIFFFLLNQLGSNEFLVGNFWCELDPLVGSEGNNVTEEEATKRVLEEARYVFSGMIYGFKFEYTPSDKRRKINDYFKMDPLLLIKWGDEKLRVKKLWIKNNKYYLKIMYEMDEYQEKRMKAWSSNIFPKLISTGSSDYFKGYKNKIKAYEDAVRQASRAYLRKKHYNKPRVIIGEAAFTSIPYNIIDSGFYKNKLSIALNIKNLKDYKFR